MKLMMDLGFHIDKLQNELESIIQGHLNSEITHSGGYNPDGLYNKCKTALNTALIDILLEKTNKNQTKMAEILGINRGSLRNLLKKHGYI